MALSSRSCNGRRRRGARGARVGVEWFAMAGLVKMFVVLVWLLLLLLLLLLLSKWDCKRAGDPKPMTLLILLLSLCLSSSSHTFTFTFKESQFHEKEKKECLFTFFFFWYKHSYCIYMDQGWCFLNFSLIVDFCWHSPAQNNITHLCSNHQAKEEFSLADTVTLYSVLTGSCALCHSL